MYGLTKVANEYNYNGHTREEQLRDQLDDKITQLRILEGSIPNDLKRDQRRAEVLHTLGGTGLGAATGAGLGVLASKGNRGPGALLGGAAGSLFGVIGGAVSGNAKSQRLLDEREPELSSALDQASLEQMDADDRLRRHVSYAKPELNMQREAHKRKMERQDAINGALLKIKTEL